MKKLIAGLLVLLIGCGPVIVNTPSVSINRKMAFALDKNGQFTFLPESSANAIYLSDIFGNFLTRIQERTKIRGWCDFSPSNDMILFVERGTSDEGEERFIIKVYNLKTEKEEPEFISTKFIWSPKWAYNGKYISFVAEGRNEITVINWRDNEVVYRIKTNSIFYRWLPDCSGFLTVDILAEVDSIDGGTLQYFVIRKKYLEKEKETEDLIWGYSRSCWPDISMDGKKIVFNAVEFSGPMSFMLDKIDQKENVYLYDCESRKVTLLTKGGISAFYTVISPDSAKVAFVDYDDDILSGGDIWVCRLIEDDYKLERLWSRGKATYPFWCENNILGFIKIDSKEKTGKGFDDILIYNLGNSNLTSLKKRIKALYKSEESTK